MSSFQGWTPPPGVAVVAPPCHPNTVVDVIYSDGSREYGMNAGLGVNWSSFGDGPRVVAYAVVQEYRPKPEVFAVTEAQLNRWIVAMGDWDRGGADAVEEMEALLDRREVPDPSREVVAWAVVGDSARGIYSIELAEEHATRTCKSYGGKIVKLVGQLP